MKITNLHTNREFFNYLILHKRINNNTIIVLLDIYPLKINISKQANCFTNKTPWFAANCKQNIYKSSIFRSSQTISGNVPRSAYEFFTSNNCETSLWNAHSFCGGVSRHKNAITNLHTIQIMSIWVVDRLTFKNIHAVIKQNRPTIPGDQLRVSVTRF